MAEFEIHVLDWFQTLHSPVLDTIMVGITTLGNAGLLWLLLGIVLVAIPKTRKSGVLVWVAIIIDAILCNGILKNLFARIRPFDMNTAIELLITSPKDYSFPSGHTAVSFAAVAALIFAGEKKLWRLALIPAVLIAVSRLYLYVHYPTDILGGIGVGILAGWLGYIIVTKLEGTFKGRFKRKQKEKNEGNAEP